MRGEVHWLRDMVVRCDMIVDYVSGVTYDEFLDDHMRRDAVCYRLAVIGESVGQVLERLRILLPAIPWTQVKGMRNLVLHDFFSVDPRTVGDTAQHDVPELLAALRTVVRPEE